MQLHDTIQYISIALIFALLFLMNKQQDSMTETLKEIVRIIINKKQ